MKSNTESEKREKNQAQLPVEAALGSEVSGEKVVPESETAAAFGQSREIRNETAVAGLREPAWERKTPKAWKRWQKILLLTLGILLVFVLSLTAYFFYKVSSYIQKIRIEDLQDDLAIESPEKLDELSEVSDAKKASFKIAPIEKKRCAIFSSLAQIAEREKLMAAPMP